MSWPGKDAGPESLGSGGEEKGSQGPQCAGTVPGMVDWQGRVVAAAGGGQQLRGLYQRARCSTVCPCLVLLVPASPGMWHTRSW